MSRQPHADPDSQAPQQGALGYFARFVWMLIGPAVAIISLMLILPSRQSDLGSADVSLWCAIIACVVFRYIDVSRLNGLKATGEPASIADWRRYTLIMTILALVLWGIGRGAAILDVLRR